MAIMRAIPMSEASPGSFRVDSVVLPLVQASRLNELGLRRGLVVCVLQVRGDGGVVVACGDSRIAVDGATAARVWLVALPTAEDVKGTTP